MQSRMDKYNSSDIAYKSRTQRNQDLYKDVKNSSLTDFDVNSNVSVIDTDANSIDVNKLSKILDEKYNEYAPKRKSIDIPAMKAYEDEPIIEQPLVDTKEYDINAILEKAKQGKNVDYNKERLKKVREAQYEILNNLDLELKKVEDAKRNNERKAEEDNLMSLINTITELETKNKEAEKNKTTESSLDLLSAFSDDAEADSTDEKLPPAKVIANPDLDITRTQKEIKLIVVDPEKAKLEDIKKEEKEPEKKKEEEKKDNYIEKTLSKLNIDLSSYDDFSDVSKRDTGTIVIKVAIFIIIIGLVIGAVYILNILLDLGLF